MATSRPSFRSRARYTAPIPPTPIGPRTSNDRTRAPGESCISGSADYTFFHQTRSSNVFSELEAELFHRGFFVLVNRRVIRQAHDLKRLVNDGREAAEGNLAVLFHHLLDDFDEDADADRVHDFRFAQVQQQRAHPVVHQLVGPIGDLFAADVVDVALGIKNRAL